MLCNKTMRAALAPVIGLLGALVAFTAGADVQLGRKAQDDDGPDVNAPQRYAAETLSNTGCFKIGRSCYGYRIVASGQTITLADSSTYQGTNASQMLIRTLTTTLLPSTDVYYVRYDFGGAILAQDLETSDLTVEAADADGNLQNADNSNAVADGGERADNYVVFELDDSAVRYLKGTQLTLDLSGAQSADLTDTTAVDEEDPGFAEIFVTGTGPITATMRVYDSIRDAREGNGQWIIEESGTIAQIDRVVGGSITSMSDTADVSTSVEDGGPFRRFLPGGTGGKDSGVLGRSTTTVKKKGKASWSRGYRNATTGADVADSIVASLKVSVTSAAGNFAVATKAGGAIVGGKGEPTNRKPWMMSSSDACTNGPLTLGVVGGTIETYQRKACPVGSAATCDGDPDGKDGPFGASDLTPAGIASANIASGTAGQGLGDNYFCVLATGNTDPIPEIGDPDNPGEYSLSVTPVLKNAEDHPFKPAAITKDVGAIDRNGTTVHLTYLTTNPFVDQRLVLVNRGADPVHFWIEDGSYSLEEGTTIETNDLAIDKNQMIPGKGRRVITVVDVIEFTGQDRGSATVNVAAPTRDIDVMTIQRSPFTDEVDTTLYQHAGS